MPNTGSLEKCTRDQIFGQGKMRTNTYISLQFDEMHTRGSKIASNFL